MSSESWPPQLKNWVAKCLGQMTDANRNDAQAELRQKIAKSFAENTLWTTEWDKEILESLQPKFITTLKRKVADGPANSGKKNKKQKHALASDYNDQAALSRRAARFQREHELERQKSRGNGAQSSLMANAHHAHLFYSAPASRSNSPSYDDPNVLEWDQHTIVGTSQELFKDYLRLTSEPKPEHIRPLPVLRQTLDALKDKWREKAPYNWICNQFKSLRQDLTVQRIKNEFTVLVYEQHARMALENSDMVQYNQCQATLKTLYELGIPGKVQEFTAYRILLLLHGRNSSELNLYVGQLTATQKSQFAVKHALDVQRSLATGNYHKLFLLYLDAPNMGGYIMDHFINRERAKALMVITKAYKTIPLSYLEREFAFESSAQLRDFLVAHTSAIYTNPNSPDSEKVLDCKPVIPQLAQAFDDKYRKVGIVGAI